MEYCFDQLQYRNDKIICSGWAAPETAGKELKIQVTDNAGHPVAADIRKVSRPDVGDFKYHDVTYDMYGFEMRFPCSKTGTDYKFCFYAAGEENDCMEVPFSPRSLYVSYLKRNSLPGKIKRFLKSDDKKNFWKLEKYLEYDKKDKEYAIWREMQLPTGKALAEQQSKTFAEQPLISLVVPVYHPKLNHLKEMIASVSAQTYANWELCIACADEEKSPVGLYLCELQKSNHKVKVQFLKENGGISANTNQAAAMASGSWIAFMDQDDILRRDAFYEYVRAAHMQNADVIYCDEDKLDDETGIYFEPNFKPDFNSDLLTCNNYICHMVMVRSSLRKEAGDLDPSMDGAQDHDFLLRCSEKTDHFVHIPKILYTWRCHRESTALNPESKSYAYENGVRAIENHYARLGICARVTPLDQKGWYRTSFVLSEKPLVSILIPNKDHGEDLLRCINSLKKSVYQNYEILIIENNSEKQETFELYQELTNEDKRIRVITWRNAFNYAAINNYAAKYARGEYLLLLNNDTELISEDAITSMLGYCMRPQVAAVGAKLYYGDDTIQHAGVLVGVSEGADHVFLRCKKHDPGYMCRAIVSQDMSAVTAACMLVKASAYRQVSGMEEQFTVAYNDVDFCLKLRKEGYYVVYDAFAEWYHYESVSRGYEETEEQKQRFEEEKKLLRSRWPVQMLGDPYYNKNLSLKHGYYQI